MADSILPDPTPRELALQADLAKVTADRDALLSGRPHNLQAHLLALGRVLARQPLTFVDGDMLARLAKHGDDTTRRLAVELQVRRAGPSLHASVKALDAEIMAHGLDRPAAIGKLWALVLLAHELGSAGADAFLAP